MTIQAVLFDMDGLLIDSEPLWQDAEIAVFAELGVQLTRRDCMRTMGLRIDEVIAYWHERRPWPGPGLAEVQELVVREVVRLVGERGAPLPGVQHALAFAKDQGCKRALASSSNYRIIDAVLEKLGIRAQFDAVYSAQDEAYGKPHPSIYLTTAQRLGVAPTACLAIEDSLFGVIAAKAARMACIAVPGEIQQDRRKFAIADVVLDSLVEIDAGLWERLNR